MEGSWLVYGVVPSNQLGQTLPDAGSLVYFPQLSAPELASAG